MPSARVPDSRCPSLPSPCTPASGLFWAYSLLSSLRLKCSSPLYLLDSPPHHLILAQMAPLPTRCPPWPRGPFPASCFPQRLPPCHTAWVTRPVWVLLVICPWPLRCPRHGWGILSASSTAVFSALAPGLGTEEVLSKCLGMNGWLKG